MIFDENGRKFGISLQNTEMDTKSYREAASEPITGFNCKMIFNSSKYLNGKMAVGFIEITNAVVEVYKWPDFSSDGIIENNDVQPARYGEKYEAPSDWTIILSYYFGPAAARIRTSSWVNWYTEADEESIEKMWQPTNTYWQPWVNCTNEAGFADDQKCQNAESAEGSGKPPFQFDPKCCLGSKNGIDFENWCIPKNFLDVQSVTSNY